MKNRLLKWLVFSIFFSVIPLGIDDLLAFSKSGHWAGFAEIIGKGELCLIAVTLSTVGLGEMYGAEVKGANLSTLLGAASLFNALIGIALYVIMKSSSQVFPLFLTLSLILFASTVVVSSSCISASES